MLEALYRSLVAAGFTDPIHAPLTHLPIGLVFGAVVFFAIALLFRRARFELTARHVAILGFVMAFPTILFGVFDWMHYYHAVLFPAIKAKMILAGILLVLLGAGIILGGEAKLNKAWLAIVYAGAFACVITLGWLGGGIVFGGGIKEVAAAPAATSAAPSATSRSFSEARAGEEAFRTNCAACHAGGGNVVAAGFPLKTSRKLDSLSAFTAFIRKPAKPDGSAGDMPAFSAEDIPDESAEELYDYVRSQLAVWK